MMGQLIHDLARRLWGINRSITGDGVRETLSILKEHMPALTIHEVPSGTQVFDWQVPKEWRISDAWITTPGGERICDFKENNLHLMGYSTPVEASMSLQELQQHLYSLPDQPGAIPYITSYYAECWGFCLSQKDRDALEDGNYEVVIKSELFDGSLTYAELVIPGASDKEVLLSTYICHPSMANNELSGPTVATYLAKWLTDRANNKYTYRFVFLPETIGSITYLSKNVEQLKQRVIAGFNITCVGDDRDYSFLPSRHGNTLSDQVSRHVLKHICPSYKSYSWNDRGSDERQYCAPGIDLPIASIMRTIYGAYEEYHTSLDDLENVVTPDGLEGGFQAIKQAIEVLELDSYPQVTVFCEPQLGKRGLYPTVSTKTSGDSVRLMMNMISYSDGKHSLLEISELCEVPLRELWPIVEKLKEYELLELHDEQLPA